MTKNIFIVGGDGFVNSILKLSKEGHNVFILITYLEEALIMNLELNFNRYK